MDFQGVDAVRVGATPPPAAMSEIYEFADFRLNVRERVLERLGGERVALPDKAFDTLCVLVRNAGKLVEKEEVLKSVWADSFVEENNLNKSIHSIRRALGEDGDRKFVETVKKYGFRFVAEVKVVVPEPAPEETADVIDAGATAKASSVREFPYLVRRTENTSAARALAVAAEPDQVTGSTTVDPSKNLRPVPKATIAKPRRSLFYPAVIAAVVAVVVFGGAFLYKYVAPVNVDVSPRLAVLPLKPLDPSDNYLGFGVADAIIRRISQTGTLTVRPTSAVRRYLNEETDALTAARELGVDVVLEGTVQRADDRLRVSVNLLRVSDGSSLWADNFDMSTSDAFAIQDKVAQQVAASLQVRLDPARMKRLDARYQPDPVAYEYYLKGVYNLDQRGFNIEGKPQNETTIGLLTKSIDADPNFAPAHAQLAYAYAWMALYVDEKAQDEWAELAKREIERADTLDPQLAETRVARHHVLLSAHEGFQTEAAARELILAKRLDPNVGGLDLTVAYNHLGLEDLADREMQRTLDIDPTSQFNKDIFGYQLMYAKRYDDWFAYQQRYYNAKPTIPYLLGKGRLDEAQKLIEKIPNTEHLDTETAPTHKAILLALKGDHQAAEAEIPNITRSLPYKNNNYHHWTYNLACLYALIGKSAEAVKWLRETAATGFPSYPVFERDRYLDPITKAPEFVEFMREMKEQNERLRREFAQ